MQIHTVTIYRGEDKQWRHRFTHANGHILAEQSEGLKRKDAAIKSAVTSYGLGILMPDPYSFALPSYISHTGDRLDVNVLIQDTRR